MYIRKQDSTSKTTVGLTVSLPIDLDNEDDGFLIASTVDLLLLRTILKLDVWTTPGAVPKGLRTRRGL